MKWYFAYNAYTEESQFPLIRMAVNSARRYTDLEPNCIISGPRGACSDWLESRGVRLHFRDVRIIDDLVRHKDANPNFDLNAARGAYLRLEIGDIERDDKFVLYTDTDVMFRSIDGIGSVRPWLLSMAPDVDQRDWRNPNTGVMIINVPRFRRWSHRIYDFARRNLSEMLNHDQTAIVQVLGLRLRRRCLQLRHALGKPRVPRGSRTPSRTRRHQPPTYPAPTQRAWRFTRQVLRLYN